MTSATRLLLVLALGAVLGVLSWWADRLPPNPRDPVAAIIILGNLPGPWIAVAFVAGVAARDGRRGAVAGLAALGTAVAAYYVARGIAGDMPSEMLVPVLGRWLPVVAIAGPLFGVAGGLWRAGRPRWATLGLVLLGGALLGEAALLIADAHPYNPFFVGQATYMVAAAEATIGIALPLWRSPPAERPFALAGTLLSALLIAAATLASLLVFFG